MIIVLLLLGGTLIILAIISYKLLMKLTTGLCKSSVCLQGKTAIITGANTGKKITTINQVMEMSIIFT